MVHMGACWTISIIFILNANIAQSYMYRVNPETDFYDQLQELIEERDLQEQLARKNWPQSFREVKDWPKTKLDKDITQVCGIDVTKNGQVHIFHRSDHVWDGEAFNEDNIYLHKDKGPINKDTVLIYNASTGALISSWGQKKFFLPHGITIDKDGNTFVTDVALHQVFKFKPGENEPSIVLGEAFVPASDMKHFCKPTDVAVASNGMFFVSDGYCNSRIMKFKANGEFIQEFGTEDWLTIPHGMSLDEENDRLFVADRENSRVVCYSAGLNNRRTGIKLFVINKPNMGRVFALAQADHNLFAVTGTSGDQDDTESNALLQINLDNKQLVKTWRPSDTDLLMPHDMALDHDRQFLYIVDADESAKKKIYKIYLGN